MHFSDNSSCNHDKSLISVCQCQDLRYISVLSKTQQRIKHTGQTIDKISCLEIKVRFCGLTAREEQQLALRDSLLFVLRIKRRLGRFLEKCPVNDGVERTTSSPTGKAEQIGDVSTDIAEPPEETRSVINQQETCTVASRSFLHRA